MKLRHTFLNISIFGYTLHVFRRRVFYYLYLKFTKYFLYSCENLRLTYRQYIRSEDLGSQLNLKAHDLYILLTQSQSNRIKNERVKSVGEILKGRLEIFNYCLFSYGRGHISYVTAYSMYKMYSMSSMYTVLYSAYRLYSM